MIALRPAAVPPAAALRPHDIVVGLLAALAHEGVETIRSDDMHARFGAALAVCEAAAFCFRDIVSHTFDVLDEGLAVAQGAGFGVWVAPAYARFAIQLTPRAVTRLLGGLPAVREGLLAAARAYRDTPAAELAP